MMFYDHFKLDTFTGQIVTKSELFTREVSRHILRTLHRRLLKNAGC